MDWLLISCIGSFIAAVVLGIALLINRRNDSRWIDIERRDYDRMIRHGDQHPWVKP